ncbi:hypothetical protein [Corynebacterium durum]|uniref:hypothetical protein n=1 Tax=Corynebacterium durum TaxID=61592 RepID=UPI00288A1FCC|nr:hypothetical protein [Corynebacterium durum]
MEILKKVCVKDLASRIFDATPDCIVASSTILLIASQVPVINSLFWGNISLTSQSFLSAFLVGIYCKLFVLDRNNKKKSKCYIDLPSPAAVYQHLFSIVDETRNPKKKVLQVMGMNMRSAWPYISLEIESGRFDDWSLEFATFVGTDFNDSNLKRWSDDSTKNIQSMLRSRSSEDVKARKISISAYSYSYAPAVHGFRLGNGDIFISILHRSSGSGKLTLKKYSYEFISHKDMSRKAICSRELFDSWWNAASKNEVFELVP